MAVRVPVCRLCEKAHWSYQGHVLARSVVKNVVVERVERVALPAEAEVKHVEPSMVLVGKAGESGARACEQCGKALVKPLKGPWPRFCGDTCRKKASRKKP